jgi:hypothetical protein
VVHLAAQAGVRYSLEKPLAYVNRNVVGFLSILEGCRHHGIEHLVYASSSSVYGGNQQLPFSEQHAVNHPVSLYAATKKANELMAHTYSHLYGLAATGLRFFTVYGPWGRPDIAPMLFARAILAGEPIQVFNQGRMKRDFTYIDDIVEVVVRCLDKPVTAAAAFDSLAPDPATAAVPHRLFNICNSEPVPCCASSRCWSRPWAARPCITWSRCKRAMWSPGRRIPQPWRNGSDSRRAHPWRRGWMCWGCWPTSPWCGDPAAKGMGMEVTAAMGMETDRAMGLMQRQLRNGNGRSTELSQHRS